MQQVHVMVSALLALVGSGGCLQPSAGTGSQARPVLYPLPPARPRVAYLTGIDDAAVMGHRSTRMARFLFGPGADSVQEITKPFGLAAAAETLLVCDTRANLVHVFDFKNRRVETMGAGGPGALLKPVAVALDEMANRYVADTLRQEVVVFSPAGEPLRALKPPGDTAFKPVAVACHGGKLYVVNGALHRVEVLDSRSGALVDAFGEKGRGPGQMLFPNGVAVDAGGQVYVTDLLNCRVQVFAPDGHLVRSFGRRGDHAGEFSRPKHLAVGPDGTIFVVDAAFQRVQAFDEQGRVLMLFGGPGTKPGDLTLPAGICIDTSLLPRFAEWMPPGFKADYLVFVSDQFGRRKISVYAFGSMTGS